jgi:hypothetical protein
MKVRWLIWVIVALGAGLLLIQRNLDYSEEAWRSSYAACWKAWRAQRPWARELGMHELSLFERLDLERRCGRGPESADIPRKGAPDG